MLPYCCANPYPSPVAEADATELLRFETENRAFFGRFIAGFGDDYYSLEAVKVVLAERTEDWKNDDAYFYLIRVEGELVGRISLFDVQRGSAQMAQIGYRVAEKHSGKGHAQAAVALAMREAFGAHALHRLGGVTSPTNLASQFVLLKNGFAFWGRSRRSYLLNGV